MQMEPSPNPSKIVASAAFTRLARDSAFEFALTAVMLFGVVSIVRWVIGPSPVSRAIPQIHTELGIVGAAVGLLLAGLILSPLGRASGGHTNPAISLAMWRFGVFPGAGVLPYAVAQLLGSVVGVVAAREVWGPVVAAPSVDYAALQPGPGWSTWGLFAGEALGMAVIIFIVGVCLTAHRLAPLVPWIVGALVGTGIAALGTATGGSLNPARQFGPAILSSAKPYLWVYLLAPMVGAELAARFRQAIQSRHAVMTHKLCGTLGDDHTGTPKHNDHDLVR
jgi:glycerol uptake facilitator-like aquaporin